MIIGMEDSSDFQVNCNQTFLQQVSEINILVIIFDRKLGFESHIKNVSKKIRRTTGIISRVRYYLPDFTLNILYKSLIKSIISCFGAIHTKHISIN